MDLDLLLGVEKPSRYLGGEVNQVCKDRRSVRCTVGLCYPDAYEIGTSHLGLQVLYQVVNAQEDLAAERVFCPWSDLEAALRRTGERLTTLETGTPLAQLDVLGFTLQYELSYTNLLTVLDLGGIPLLASQREPHHPIVIGGGPCAYNPEPLGDVLDAVCLGDGEELLPELCRVVASWRARGDRPRRELLEELATLQGVYVPSFYRAHRDDSGRLLEMEPLDGAPALVQRRVLADLDAALVPGRPVIPFGKAVHDRLTIEVQRGCARGCRFCQAGIIYRPVRERSPETIRRAIREGLSATGAGEVGLLSLSTGDYTCLPDLLQSLICEHARNRVALSLPSMRLETLTGGLLDDVRTVRKSGLTLAPEAGSARLRSVINKNFDENLLFDAIRSALSRGWRSLKLYFMIGLPTEQRADLEGIVDLVHRCRSAAWGTRRNAQLRVSVSNYVPKSHTPFQWCAQMTTPEAEEKQRWLRGELRMRGVEARFHSARQSSLEGLFSRGGREVGPVLLSAWRSGARLDGWGERLDMDVWERAIEENDLDPVAITASWRERDEILPWDHLSCGVGREWLWSEYESALEATSCPDCTTHTCYQCGTCDPPRVRNRLYDADDAGRRARAVVEQRPCATPSRPWAAAESAAVLDTRLPRDRRQRIQVRYGRRGRAALLSHLETVAVLQRALRRTSLPLIHTSGFNPRIKMNFTDPNPVGMESDAEYFEVEILAPFRAGELVEPLRAELPAGFVVLDAREAPPEAPALSQRVRSLVYRIEGIGEDSVASAARLLHRPFPITVERKKGIRSVDVSQVARVEASEGPAMMLTLAAGAGVKPAEVVEALVGTTLTARAFRKVEAQLASVAMPRKPLTGVPNRNDGGGGR